MSQESVETSPQNRESIETSRKNGESIETSRKNGESIETFPQSGESVEIVRIHTEFITLQDLLKLTGAVDTGGEAKLRVQNGEASVNGAPCLQRGKKLRPGDTVAFRGKTYAVGHGQ